jgi:hypothetical protein
MHMAAIGWLITDTRDGMTVEWEGMQGLGNSLSHVGEWDFGRGSMLICEGAMPEKQGR